MDNKFEHSEDSILDILNRKFLSSPKYTINNLYVFGWESDYLALTTSGYWYEIEVKISKSDFKADFGKVDKHSTLATINKSAKPNYFYYAVPDGLIDIEDVPEYAGLIYISGIHYQIIKPAPKLHTEKLKINLQDKFYYNWKGERSNRRKLAKEIKSGKQKYENEVKAANFWKGYLNGEVNACSEMLGIIKGYLKEDHPLILEIEELISEKDIALTNTNTKVSIV